MYDRPLSGGTRRSVLELRRGGLPFPHGDPDGAWRYRHAVRPDGPTPLDHQAVSDFLTYERAHHRHVDVVGDPDLADWAGWHSPAERPAPGEWPSQCCTHAYDGGCGSALVCHGAPLQAAVHIAEAAELRPASAITGRSPSELAEASSWGEPPDYFEHDMFANGLCTAPEAVASSRTLVRDLVPTDLRPGYPPSVRFYFEWAALAALPTARFDGVHPVKVLGRVALDQLLVAVVVHSDQAPLIGEHILSSLRDRVLSVSVPHPTPQEWAADALSAARRLA